MALGSELNFVLLYPKNKFLRNSSNYKLLPCFIRNILQQSLITYGATVTLSLESWTSRFSSELEDPGSRLAWRKLPCTLMAPGACKIHRGCNVLHVPIQIIPLGVPKWGSHPLRGGSIFWWHVSGPSSRSILCLSPRPLAIAYCIARPMLNSNYYDIVEELGRKMPL